MNRVALYHRAGAEEEQEEDEFGFDDFSEMVNVILTIVVLSSREVEARQIRKYPPDLLFT